MGHLKTLAGLFVFCCLLGVSSCREPIRPQPLNAEKVLKPAAVKKCCLVAAPSRFAILPAKGK